MLNQNVFSKILHLLLEVGKFVIEDKCGENDPGQSQAKLDTLIGQIFHFFLELMKIVIQLFTEEDKVKIGI